MQNSYPYFNNFSNIKITLAIKNKLENEKEDIEWRHPSYPVKVVYTFWLNKTVIRQEAITLRDIQEAIIFRDIILKQRSDMFGSMLREALLFF